MARDMAGPMTGASAWMMTDRWDVVHMLLLWAMWVVMMAGMMLPSVAPVLCGGAPSAGDAPANRRGAGGRLAFAGGYLLVWTGFSTVATVGQRILTGCALLSPMMELSSRALGGGVMIFAGLYQFLPFTTRCLTSCRCGRGRSAGPGGSPTADGFAAGVSNGLSCLGCCWALMLLLFVGGVMNLALIVALTVLVLVEKAAPFGVAVARVAGGLLACWGAWLLYRGVT